MRKFLETLCLLQSCETIFSCNNEADLVLVENRLSLFEHSPDAQIFFWPKMSILGLDQALQLANQYQALADGGDGGDGEDGDRRGRGRGQLRRGRGRGQLRRGRGRGRLGRGLMQANHNRQGEARRAGALSSMKQRQLVRQSLHFNKTGHARTLDHQLPGQDFKRRKPTGKGKWKTWTPEAVLRVGFGNETATCRQLANEVEGASPQELSRSRHLFATFVTRMQTLLGPICKSYWEF